MPQVKLAHELRKKGIAKNRIAFVLCRVGKSIGEKEAAIEFVENAGYYYAGFVQERTSIGQCHDNGLAANETRYNSINKTVDDLIQNIGDKINQLDNK
jgi:chromosome partitioning protein